MPRCMAKSDRFCIMVMQILYNRADRRPDGGGYFNMLMGNVFLRQIVQLTDSLEPAVFGFTSGESRGAITSAQPSQHDAGLYFVYPK